MGGLHRRRCHGPEGQRNRSGVWSSQPHRSTPVVETKEGCCCKAKVGPGVFFLKKFSRSRSVSMRPKLYGTRPLHHSFLYRQRASTNTSGCFVITIRTESQSWPFRPRCQHHHHLLLLPSRSPHRPLLSPRSQRQRHHPQSRPLPCPLLYSILTIRRLLLLAAARFLQRHGAHHHLLHHHFLRQ